MLIDYDACAFVRAELRGLIRHPLCIVDSSRPLQPRISSADDSRFRQAVNVFLELMQSISHYRGVIGANVGFSFFFISWNFLKAVGKCQRSLPL